MTQQERIGNCIKKIYKVVWNYNEYRDGEVGDWDTCLTSDPKSAAEEIIECAKLVSNKSEAIRKTATERIITLTRPDNWAKAIAYDSQREANGKIEFPMIICTTEDALRLISICSTLLDELKTSKDPTMETLNRDWTNKFLVFNGDEDGMQIVWANRIYFLKDDIVFDGTIIELVNDNHYDGEGVLVTSVYQYKWDNLYYIEYHDEDVAKEFGFEDDMSIDEGGYEILKLLVSLKSKPVDLDLDSRVISYKEVLGYIDDAIQTAIDKHMPRGWRDKLQK